MHAEDTTLPTTRPSAAAPRPSLQEFLGQVLAEQQRLDTPVVRASAAFDAHATAAGAAPAAQFENRTSLFRDLIPLSKPQAGEQYAFEVNLDACSGCKACVAACHALNGLDDTESWRDVGLVVTHDVVQPWQQTVTTACHHCAEPGCLEGCPVVAYEKDPVTGIVRHLDDQCIGCSYCVLKCPYDVPKYNVRLGIVRKCDMCHQRLAVDEAPACVQSCPTSAIRIVTVPVAARADAATGARVDTGKFLPAAPDASYTQPTTRYVSARGVPAAMRAADADAIRVQPAHAPLALMLTLTQVGLGLFASAAVAFEPPSPAVDSAVNAVFAPVAAAWTALRGPGADVPTPVALVGAALFLAGLAASVLHLGQPTRAWRVFLGLRTSWLSREAVLFGGFAPLLLLALWRPDWRVVQFAATAVGLAAVYCSAMVYIDTRRKFWGVWPTTFRFGGATLVAALAFVVPPVAALALGAKLLGEFRGVHGSSVSARIQRGPLRPLVFARLVCALVAGAAFVAGSPWLGLVPFLLGELAERVLFFRAVDAPKMPGLPSLP